MAVAEALALIEAARKRPALDALAARVGYAPHHFHRLFKRATGVTPAAYARGLKARARGGGTDRGAACDRGDLRGRLFGAEPLLRSTARRGSA